MIDGDNVSHTLAGCILVKAGRHGETIIKRAYCDAAHFNGWSATSGFHILHSGTGKNATDLLLTVEAMALMLNGRADVLVIAASDRDFSHLATHLREAGHKVVGLGEDKTSDAFRKSCSVFMTLSVNQAAAPPAPPPNSSNLESRVMQLLRSEGDANGLPFTTLNARMRVADGTKISAMPEKNWRKWFDARPTLFAVHQIGPDAWVKARLPTLPASLPTA